ncbi:MAG: ABC transporter substrate-binding protein [Alphaproteobacteria bacterium]|nr:ABC transporter substrate-binding protein [Alphaproteobacteria bacterium]
MRRRDFIAAIYAAALASPYRVAAQQPGKVWRIGDLYIGTPEVARIYAQALERSLADLGYVQGRNIVLLVRYSGSQRQEMQEAIISLLPQVDLLVVRGNAAIEAKKLAGAVPTVFISIGYPVELGLVQSLAHPDGNMTGITAEAALETNGKRLQILKDIVPHLSRVAVLRDIDTRQWGFEWTALDQAGHDLGLTLDFVDIKSADDLEGAFTGMKRSDAEALFVTRTNLTYIASKQIADLALATRLPSCWPFRESAIAGGLVSYGPDRVAMVRPAAAQIDKIIKGTSPGDIPVEQPTIYELYINLKTARALDLTIPPTLLARADEVIE